MVNERWNLNVAESYRKAVPKLHSEEVDETIVWYTGLFENVCTHMYGTIDKNWASAINPLDFLLLLTLRSKTEPYDYITTFTK